MKYIKILLILFITNTFGQSKKSNTIIFPLDLEKEIALSALPKHLRDGSGIYIYHENKGYELIKKSENGFVALVERIPGIKGAFAPVSYDAVGQRHHLKRIIEVGRWIAEGIEPNEIRARVTKGFKDGKFSAPNEFGISYMLSPVNILPSPPKGKPALYYPHYMVYAPNIAPNQLGLPKFHWHSYHPMILDQGPHGYLIFRVGDKETEDIRTEHKDLIKKVEAFLGKKLSSYEVAKNHNH